MKKQKIFKYFSILFLLPTLIILTNVISVPAQTTTTKYEYSKDKVEREKRERNKTTLSDWRGILGNKYSVIKTDVEFYESPKELKGFYLRETEKFKIIDLIPEKSYFGDYEEYRSFYKILFDSGKIAYIKVVSIKRNEDVCNSSTFRSLCNIKLVSNASLEEKQRLIDESIKKGEFKETAAPKKKVQKIKKD